MTCDSKEYAQSPCPGRQIRAEEHMQGGERQGPGKRRVTTGGTVTAEERKGT